MLKGSSTSVYREYLRYIYNTFAYQDGYNVQNNIKREHFTIFDFEWRELLYNSTHEDID